LHTIGPYFERALLLAVGNTLVCERLDEAEVFAWDSDRDKGKKHLSFYQNWHHSVMV